MDALFRKLPDFLIIGAQKSGTTWLWEMLKQHPGTSLPARKEIHFFGSVEIYRKGLEWYAGNFSDVTHGKVTGEASTTYLYDRMPYWYNASRHIEFDESLPSIPQLVTRIMPRVKVLIVLRDPVRRAVSAYRHYVRRGDISPRLGLARTATKHPKLRILEYGRYARYIAAWQQYVEPENMRILLFEEDICKEPEQTVRDVYGFLGLDRDHVPEKMRKPIHKSWGWTRSVVSYYADPLTRRVVRSRLGAALDRFDILPNSAVTAADVGYLRDQFLPEKSVLEAVVGRPLGCWDYGAASK